MIAGGIVEKSVANEMVESIEDKLNGFSKEKESSRRTFFASVERENARVLKAELGSKSELSSTLSTFQPLLASTLENFH